MNLPELLGWISTVLGLLIGACYAYQIVYLFAPLVIKKRPHGPAKQTRYAVLIAARNEERVLPHLLQSIRNQDYPAELVTTYVIADNCTDRTAEIARSGGATVFCRFNKEKVGKGYALNYLLEKIRLTDGLDKYDAFLIFDADNLLEPDYIRNINQVCSDGYDAFCGYRNSKNFHTNWVSAGQSLWYLHDSTHLNRSRMLLGNPCAVTGTGFGFTRALLERMGGWNFFTLTEDIEFSTWCATRGIRVGYCHDAMLYDEQPDRFSVSWRQRTRWVQGGIQISVRCAGDLFRGMMKGGRTGYASLETTTLTLWGYAAASATGLLSLFVRYLQTGWPGVAYGVLCALLTSYWGLLLMGFMTLVMEWPRIRATDGQKVAALFTFPVFMMAYLPIGISAFFRKFHWPPIEHTHAVSARELQSTSTKQKL